MAEILLINPPSPFLVDPKCEPPLGLLYLASAVEHLVKSRVIDLGNQKLSKKLLDKTLNSDLQDCKIVGITAVTPQIRYAEEIARYIKSVRKDIIVIIGGPHVAALNGNVWLNGENWFDIGVIGEGEKTFRQLVARILDNKNYVDEPGIAYLDKQSQLQLNPSRSLIPIDEVKLPARSHLDLNLYSRHVGGRPATTLITSRGCPFRCAYCMKGTWGNKVRRHCVRYVVDELKQIKYEYDFNGVLFVDDNFTLNRHWMLDFCKQIKELDMKWRCWTRVNIVDAELLKIMKGAGCAEISFGIETGSQKLLDVSNKGVTLKQNMNAIKWAKEAGLITKAFLMIGIPGETKETVEETKDFIKKVEPDQWILSTFIPIAGSPMWLEPKKYGIINFDKYDFEHQWEVGLDGKGGMFIDTIWLSGKELQELHADLYSFLQEISR